MLELAFLDLLLDLNTFLRTLSIKGSLFLKIVDILLVHSLHELAFIIPLHRLENSLSALVGDIHLLLTQPFLALDCLQVILFLIIEDLLILVRILAPDLHTVVIAFQSDTIHFSHISTIIPITLSVQGKVFAKESLRLCSSGLIPILQILQLLGSQLLSGSISGLTSLLFRLRIRYWSRIRRLCFSGRRLVFSSLSSKARHFLIILFNLVLFVDNSLRTTIILLDESSSVQGNTTIYTLILFLSLVVFIPVRIDPFGFRINLFLQIRILFSKLRHFVFISSSLCRGDDLGRQFFICCSSLAGQDLLIRQILEIRRIQSSKVTNQILPGLQLDIDIRNGLIQHIQFLRLFSGTLSGILLSVRNMIDHLNRLLTLPVEVNQETDHAGNGGGHRNPRIRLEHCDHCLKRFDDLIVPEDHEFRNDDILILSSHQCRDGDGERHQRSRILLGKINQGAEKPYNQATRSNAVAGDRHQFLTQFNCQIVEVLLGFL